MNRKPIVACAIALGLLLGSAHAQTQFDGTVVTSETVSVTAPYGGMVNALNLREGEWLTAGDEVATIATNKVLAAEDGTVRGIFAQPGDSAEKTVLYLAPVSKYTINASISKAHAAVDTKYVRIGEQVYIKCAADGSHKAVGVITSVKGSDYTVQTTGGELYMEETVYLYRNKDYDSDQRIGSGTVSRTNEIAVQGTGSLLKLYVADGDEVERGQALFETVEGSVEGMIPDSGTVTTSVTGAVAQINVKVGDQVKKGDVLLTLYPQGKCQIAFSVPEASLAEVSIGSPVEITFLWDEEQHIRYQGQVLSISYVSEQTEDGEEAAYQAYATFEADESVRLGMSVSVTVQ